MTGFNRRASWTNVVFFAGTLLLLGCGNAKVYRSAPSLMEESAAQTSEEAERLHRLEQLRIYLGDGEIAEISVDQFLQQYLSQYECSPYIPPAGDPDPDCEIQASSYRYWIAYDYCRADRLLDMAETLSTASHIPWDNTLSGTLSFPPQSDATRAELALKARELYIDAMQRALLYLRDRSLPDYPGCPLNVQTAERIGDLVEWIAQGYRGASRATMFAVEKTVAIADWQRGTTSSLTEAQARMWGGAELSRAAAAHMLVGGYAGDAVLGIPGLATSWSLWGFPGADDVQTPTGMLDAFCMNPELSSGARRALAAFRESGVDPLSILSSQLKTYDLVEGTTCAGSVRERLAATRKDEALLGMKTAEDLLGVTLRDFDEARSYLKQELLTFGRATPWWSLYYSEPLTIECGGSPVEFLIYGATATPPGERHASYWSSLLRYGQLPNPPSDPLDLEPSEPERIPRSMAVFLERTGAEIRRALHDFQNDPSLSDKMDALRPLYLIEDDIDAQVPVVLSLSADDGDDFELIVNTLEPYDATDLQVVLTGHHGTECLTRGETEGMPCTHTGVGGFEPIAGGSGSYPYRYWVTIDRDAVVPGMWPLYVVGPDGNGGQKVLGSTGLIWPTMTDENTSHSLAFVYPTVPQLEEYAARIIAPSREACGRAKVECNGEAYDERLPLENELASDADPVESSWKYYLSEAEQAAARADQLAEEYFRAALDSLNSTVGNEEDAIGRRTRADSELETIQSVCGVTVDIESILEMYGPTRSLEGVVPTGDYCSDSSQCDSGMDCVAGICAKACVMDTDCNTPVNLGLECVAGVCIKGCSADGDCYDPDNPGLECVAGTCIRSAVAMLDDPDRSQVTRRIAECIGRDTLTPIVAAGNVPLCYWVDTVQPGEQYKVGDEVICGDADSNYPCPLFVAANDYACNGLLEPSGQRAKRYVAGIGLFNIIDIEQELAWIKDILPPNCAFNDTACRQILNDALLNKLVCPTVDPSLLDEGASEWQINATLNGFKDALVCTRQQLTASLGARLFVNVPTRLIRVLGNHTAVLGSYPSVGGTYGEKLSSARAALMSYSRFGELIKEEFNKVQDELQIIANGVQQMKLRHHVAELIQEEKNLSKEQVDLTIDVLELQQDAAVIQGINGAVSSLSSFDPTAPWSALGAASGMVTSVALMDNQLQQLNQQIRIQEVEKQIIDLQKEQAVDEDKIAQLGFAKEMVQARANLRARAVQIREYITELQSSYEQFDASLAGLETERERARRSLSRAIQTASSQSESRAILNGVLSNTAEMRRARYEEARRNAVQMAFLAKRAIEQRLGMRLSEIMEPMPLLEVAPAIWENEICTSTALDFERLKEDSGMPQSFAGMYVGEYVDRLGRLLESYRLQYSFHEGQDQMVLSLKEDVHKVAERCDRPGKNLLAWSAKLDAAPDPEVAASGWERTEVDVEETSTVIGPIGDEALSYLYAVGAQSGATSPALSQRVTLPQGTYVLSWYTSPAAELDLGLLDVNGTALTPSSEDAFSRDNGLERRIAVYEVDKGGMHTMTTLTLPPAGTEAVVGAATLEHLTAQNQPEDLNPPVVAAPFVATNGQALTSMFNCPDSDGSAFRELYWTRSCVPLCADGVGTGCVLSTGPEQCYWETTFALSQRDIERGYLLPRGGFAAGNYNYRIESVAANFVGTGLRSCDDQGVACYGAGFIPYSLEHKGPFTVINHLGNEFDAPLFDGRIEHAKGLALERYLTNPLSSADNGLIGSYLRQEFEGRPLDGSYSLRVWEEPGVRFDAIEDVQILVKYRYWTRTD